MSTQPTLVSAAIFSARSTALRIKRLLADTAHPLPHLSTKQTTKLPFELAQSTTPLWSDLHTAEKWYQLGKVQNLKVAAASIHRCIIPAGSIFSFWKQVGYPSRRRGFAKGRMLQEGCIVPSVGGGLCQLSNALYQVALDSGCEIVERHAHSRTVPDSAAEAGRDATVAWNYVDLRFRPSIDLQLFVELSDDALRVSAHASEPRKQMPMPSALQASSFDTPAPANNCDDCVNATCFRKPMARDKQSARHP